MVTTVLHINCTTKYTEKTLNIEIRFKKEYRNDVDILLIEIASKNVRLNNVDFTPTEITLKKCVKMTWKFINFFFLAYQRDIDMKLMSNRHDVSVALSP